MFVKGFLKFFIFPHNNFEMFILADDGVIYYRAYVKPGNFPRQAIFARIELSACSADSVRSASADSRSADSAGSDYSDWTFSNSSCKLLRFFLPQTYFTPISEIYSESSEIIFTLVNLKPDAFGFCFMEQI